MTFRPLLKGKHDWHKSVLYLRHEKNKSWKDIAKFMGFTQPYYAPNKLVELGLLDKKDATDRKGFKIGEKVGYFTVIERVVGAQNSYKLQCECGKIFVKTYGHRFKTKSCGCMLYRAHDNRTYIQGGLTAKYPTEYKSYNSMLARCKDLNNENYGGKGIKVCDKWLNGENGKTGFQCFLDDMGAKPFEEYSLDRINAKKNYEKKNCRWADKFLQNFNKKSNLWQKLEKGQITLEHMCKKYDIDINKAKQYLKHGFSARDLRTINETILGIDPGSSNFAYCVIKNNVVCETGMFQYPLKQITETNITLFQIEFNALYDRYTPNKTVIERFMVRRFLSPLVELVGIMNGYMVGRCYRDSVKVNLISSTQWKLAIKKFVDLKNLYEYGKKEYKLPPHIIDAMCMSRYIMSLFNFGPEDKKWLYDNLKRCSKNLVNLV